MGTKEERAAPREILGYHASMLPSHERGGRCHVCKIDVFVQPSVSSARAPQTFSIITYVHYSCKPLPAAKP